MRRPLLSRFSFKLFSFGKFSPPQLIALTFAATILVGTRCTRH